MADKKEAIVFDEAMQRFSQVEQADKDERQLAIEDAFFAEVPGSQWEDSVKAQFSDSGRPRYEINRISSTIDTIVGEQLANEFTMKFRPKGGGATKDIAETMNGLKRSIDTEGTAGESYNNAFEEILTGGYGGWRYVTEFSDDDTFEQDLVRKPIYDAASTLWVDPQATRTNKSDAMWMFIREELTTENFKLRYPDADVTDFENPLWYENWCKGWYKADSVTIAEYWRKVPVTRTIVQLSDGRVVELEKVEPVLDEMAAEGITVVKTAERKGFKVEQYILNGAEILEGPNEWAGREIPIVPVYGHRTVIQGKEYVRGMVRMAKDASRIFNYALSATVEAVAISPKDPLFMTTAQAKGHTQQLSNMNVSNDPVIFYEDAPNAKPPFRLGAPAVQQALIGVAQQASEGILTSMGAAAGISQPQQGTDIDTRSGVAVREQGRKGDIASFRYVASILEGIRREGEILVDLLPRIYDTERQVRIINPDGTEEFVTLNETRMDEQTGKQIIVNDLTLGKYDVAVDTGPANTTQRTEAADRLISLATNSEQFAQLVPDLIAKNLDIPGSDELHKRMRAMMIKQGIVQPTPEEVEELGLATQEPTQDEQLDTQERLAKIELFFSQAAELQSKANLNVATVEKTLAQADNEDYSSNKLAQEAQAQGLDNIKTQAEMGIPLDEQDHDIRVGQEDLIEQSQQNIQPGPTSEQALNGLSQE